MLQRRIDSGSGQLLVGSFQLYIGRELGNRVGGYVVQTVVLTPNCDARLGRRFVLPAAAGSGELELVGRRRYRRVHIVVVDVRGADFRFVTAFRSRVTLLRLGRGGRFGAAAARRETATTRIRRRD